MPTRKKPTSKKTVSSAKPRAKDAPKTPAALRREGDRFFNATPPDHPRALASYRAAADLGDDDAAQNVVYILRQYESVRDEALAERILVAMAEKGRPWAKRDLAKLLEGRELEARRPLRIAMSDTDKVHELCERFDLAQCERRLLEIARPSVLLLGHASPAPLPIGVTKLGGEPDVAPGFAWPTRAGRPLTFLGQVNLAEMQAIVRDPALPPAGLLSFFYDAKEQPWGAPGERDAWSVVFTSDVSSSTPTKAPPGSQPFVPFSLEGSRELTLPFMRTAAARELGLEGDAWERYAALYGEHQRAYCRQPPPRSDVHRFAGHPDALQGDMTRRIEYGLRAADIDVVDPEIESAAARWRLLLQVGSDFTQRMTWGDNGRVFFWIREDDLARRDFSDVRLQLQSH